MGWGLPVSINVSCAPVTSAEETAKAAVRTYSFGGKRRVRILQIAFQPEAWKRANISFYVYEGANIVEYVLTTGMVSDDDALLWSGDLEVMAEGLKGVVLAPTAAEEITFKITFRMWNG